MNPLCVRCLEVESAGNYCPVCGTLLRVTSTPPTRREVEEFISQVDAFLTRLRKVHYSLEQTRQELARRANPRAALLARRQEHLSRIEARLKEGSRQARKRLQARLA